ncbi:MAG: GDP-mannose 4,6-dehydratase [Candidatus Thermoplasmatota archaeon]|nr:GDP-mannose 4,6-dehydratase [Candidatus Thermoplasmatota archaeon]
MKELKGKKILITGGLGFIGSNLANECVKHGAHVTVFDCLDPRSGGNQYNVQSIAESLQFSYHNILDFDQVSQVVPGKDIIFNCASSTSHSFSMREPWIDTDVNSKGVINLLEAIRRFNPKVKFVHLGTSTQLGKLSYQPADENHPEFPTDIYSANKSVSEKYAIIYSKAFGIRATVVRLSNVFGPRASIHSPEFTFNNYFIGLALQEKDVTVYGDGGQMRNVLYVDDAVSALVLGALSDEANGEVFFAVADEHFSVAEIARATVKHLGGDVEFVDWPKGKKAVDVGDAILTNEKIKEILDWAPVNSLESGLAQTGAYYKDCMDQYLR